MYMDISDSMLKKLGVKPLNFCTDGDSTRRQALNSITQHEILISSALGKEVHQLQLIDRKVGKNDETVNFDAKHLVKR